MSATFLADERPRNSQEVTAQEAPSPTEGESLDGPMATVEELIQQKTPGYTFPSQIDIGLASTPLESENHELKLVYHGSFDGFAESHSLLDTFKHEKHEEYEQRYGPPALTELTGYYHTFEHSLREGNTRHMSLDFDYPPESRHTQIQQPESVDASHSGKHVGIFFH